MKLDQAVALVEGRTTISEAVKAAMDDWKSGGALNVDRMREQIDQLVELAIVEWQAENVDAITDDED